MAIARENKFDSAIDSLNTQEDSARERSGQVIRNILGNGGGKRKKKEERKAISAYIPISLYEQFNQITLAYGITNNAAICQLIRDYVTEKKKILEEI